MKGSCCTLQYSLSPVSSVKTVRKEENNMKKIIYFLLTSCLFAAAWEFFGACLVIIASLILAGIYAIYKGTTAICRWLKKAEKAMDIYIEKNKSA